MWPLVLWKSHCWPLLGTLLPLGKYQFPMAPDPKGPVWGGRQQAVWSVTQSRASSPSPISSRYTRLLFWYVVPLSENLTPSPAPEKKCLNVQYQKLNVLIRADNLNNTLVNHSFEGQTALGLTFWEWHVWYYWSAQWVVVLVTKMHHYESADQLHLGMRLLVNLVMLTTSGVDCIL